MAFARILVTGGTGFLGRQVQARLRSGGLEVHSCSRREGVDVRDGRAFGDHLRTLNPDCIVHCAAHVGGIEYVRRHAVEVFEDNLLIALGLLQAVEQCGNPVVVNIMPNCTYPGDKEIYRESEWWDGPLHDSVLMYGLPRKTLWGLAVTRARHRGLRCGHLILPNMYGPHDHFDAEKSHALGGLVAKIVQAERSNLPTVELWGTGKPVREWLYVEDAADAIAEYVQVLAGGGERRAGVDSPEASAEILNVGVGRGVTISALADTIRQSVGWRGEFVYDTSRPDGALQKLLDGERFRRLTGWRPKVDLPVGIARTVTWYQSALARHNDGYQAVQPVS